jgi:hypothetical protein
LAERLSRSEAEGRIVREAGGGWSLAGVDYEGGKVRIASLDRDELVLAPEALMPTVLEARERRRKQWSPELEALVDQVPAGVTFYTVVTKPALQRGLREASPLTALLPTPEGLLVSAIVYDYAGVFVRVPTSEPVKGWLVVSLVRRIIEGASADADDEMTSAFLRDLDISQSPDGTALMMSVIVTRANIERLLMGA